MQLSEVVKKYLELAGEHGKRVPLAAFGLPRAEVERLFGIFDEDYHLSRFFHFTASGGDSFQNNGFPCTHVAIDAEIQKAL
jgi:hypothetical protein